MPRRIKTLKPEEEYSSPINVNNQLYYCGVPFRLDTYNGCTHGCIYCFVRAAELTSAARKNRGDTILLADPNAVERIMSVGRLTQQERAAVAIEWVRHRVPIHWGGMSDPFQPCERKYGLSKRLMQTFSIHKYPVIISTKGTMMAEPEYLKLLEEGKYGVQVTVLTDNDEIAARIEPGAPSATERLRALEILAERGIWTAVRIQPMVPNSKIEFELPRYLEKLAKIGVKHVMAEGYKVPVRNEVGMKKMWDLFPEAKSAYMFSKSEGFEWHLPSWRKWKYVKVMIEECHKLGMTYGAADNDMRDMGDGACCCGADFIPGFENFWRYQASQAAVIAKEKGWVHLDDMQQFWTGGDKGFSVHNDLIRFAHKDEFGNIQATPKWAVDFMWERGGAMSPGCMFSMKKAHLDGRVVYKRTDPIPVWESQEVEQATMF